MVFSSCITVLTLIFFLFFDDCRMEAFNSVFGHHMRANRLDEISITDLEKVVNAGPDAHYSRADITFFLEVK